MSLVTNLNIPAGLVNYGEYMQNSPSYRRKVIWVGNASGLPAGSGKSPESPMSSLVGTGGALAAATSTFGTRIYVLPGHAESVSAADWASSTGTNQNIEIVAMGYGTNRATLTWTAAASTWLIDTANITIANFRLKCAGAAATPALSVATAFVVSAAGFNLIGNDIEVGIDADTLCTDCITTTAGADDMKIVGNRVHGGPLAEITTFLTTTGATDRLLIQDNRITASVVTAATGVLLNLGNAAMVENDIIGNELHNTTASSKYVITPHATSTGLVSRNMYYTGDGATAPAVSAWSTFTTTYKFNQNYCVTAVSVSGILCPAADA